MTASTPLQAINRDETLEISDDPRFSETRTEFLLRETQRRLRETQSIANLGSWDWDIITDELWWSQQIYNIFGIDLLSGRLTYEDFLNCVHPEDRAHVEDAVEHALDSGAQYDIVHRIQRPDGEVRYVRELGETFRDARGNPLRMSGTVQDVTEQKISEDRIRQHEENLRDLGKKLSMLERTSSMGTMLAAIAHELNQPIAALSLYTNRLLRQAKAWNGAPPDIVDTLTEVTHMVRVANKVVQRARRAIRPSQAPATPLVCSEAMRMVLSLMEGDLSSHGIRVVVTDPGLRHKVMADPFEFELVVLNMLRNAIDALIASDVDVPRIDIHIESVGNRMISVSIADNGVAVSQDVLDQMFEPFFTTKRGGWGMGLAICRQFAEDLGGTLSASANAPQGMIMNLTLPIHEAGGTDA